MCADKGGQSLGIELKRQADFAAADAKSVKRAGGRVNKGWKSFFHADGRAAAVNIARCRLQFFQWNHLQTFDMGGAGGFFEVELGRCRNNADKMSKVWRNDNQRFKNPVRIFAQTSRHAQRVNPVFGIIGIRGKFNFGFLQNAHGVCFNHHSVSLKLFGIAIP